MSVKGYKVFNPDWTCRDFLYKVGKTYKYEGKIGLCEAGFHFCKKVSDCFNYYPFQATNKVAEVEAIGEVIEGDNKCVTNEITIVKELSWYEVLDLVNSGDYNSGYRNSGYRNSGDYNSGNYNSGDYNSGYRNSGYRNSGDYNSGDYNSGDYNSGYRNSGDCNSGDCNSGDYNSGDYNSGYFNTINQPLYIFNKPVNMNRFDFYNLPGIIVINSKLREVANEWICEEFMTNKEKEAHPDYKITGGYLKTVKYKEAWTSMWRKLIEVEKEAIKHLPNFDPVVFKEITGINVNEQEEK